MNSTENAEDHSIFDTNKWVFFLVLCLASLFLLIVKKTFIENQTAAFEVLDSQGEMGIFHTINALQYFSIPLIYLFKFTVISFVIWIGSFMFGYKITYSQTWQVAVIAEAIFLIPELLKVLWFLFVDMDPNLFEIRAFYPLSLINLANPYELDNRWFYPLKALNIFEVIYWFILVGGIHYKAKKQKNIAYAIVFSSYVLFFLLWLGFYLLVYK
ncbi:sulfate ABC transporter permease [Fulvivirga sp. 29W222]|uniref:Sulfate ABC transporter permease n=1 Tax=Fulvivirga marina TaxID=2494733 RepID=A0A937FXK7_9BACT|nr:sulfate ABC transporter permease [Fulvivirga marina]MBL6446863.1 sulfate ABC transporter permease [Fulvivirga marina]